MSQSERKPDYGQHGFTPAVPRVAAPEPEPEPRPSEPHPLDELCPDCGNPKNGNAPCRPAEPRPEPGEASERELYRVKIEYGRLTERVTIQEGESCYVEGNELVVVRAAVPREPVGEEPDEDHAGFWPAVGEPEDAGEQCKHGGTPHYCTLCGMERATPAPQGEREPLRELLRLAEVERDGWWGLDATRYWKMNGVIEAARRALASLPASEADEADGPAPKDERERMRVAFLAGYETRGGPHYMTTQTERDGMFEDWYSVRATPESETP